jgi:hypothetical protein
VQLKLATGQPRISACEENIRIAKEEQFASRKSSRSQVISDTRQNKEYYIGV